MGSQRQMGPKLSLAQKYAISRWLIRNWESRVVKEKMSVSDVAGVLNRELADTPVITKGQIYGILNATKELQGKKFDHTASPVNSLMRRAYDEINGKIERLERIVAGMDQWQREAEEHIQNLEGRINRLNGELGITTASRQEPVRNNIVG
jgi:hypothetical protein